MTFFSDEEYTLAKTVFEEFNLKSMKDYTELYCATDTLILQDVMENFR